MSADAQKGGARVATPVHVRNQSPLTFLSKSHHALSIWLSMVWSESRYPLFRIMLACSH
jgi:hypothetical protein